MRKIEKNAKKITERLQGIKTEQKDDFDQKRAAALAQVKTFIDEYKKFVGEKSKSSKLDEKVSQSINDFLTADLVCIKKMADVMKANDSLRIADQQNIDGAFYQDIQNRFHIDFKLMVVDKDSKEDNFLKEKIDYATIATKYTATKEEKDQIENVKKHLKACCPVGKATNDFEHLKIGIMVKIWQIDARFKDIASKIFVKRLIDFLNQIKEFIDKGDAKDKEYKGALQQEFKLENDNEQHVKKKLFAKDVLQGLCALYLNLRSRLEQIPSSPANLIDAKEYDLQLQALEKTRIDFKIIDYLPQDAKATGFKQLPDQNLENAEANEMKAIGALMLYVGGKSTAEIEKHVVLIKSIYDMDVTFSIKAEKIKQEKSLLINKYRFFIISNKIIEARVKHKDPIHKEDAPHMIHLYQKMLTTLKSIDEKDNGQNLKEKYETVLKTLVQTAELIQGRHMKQFNYVPDFFAKAVGHLKSRMAENLENIIDELRKNNDPWLFEDIGDWGLVKSSSQSPSKHR